MKKIFLGLLLSVLSVACFAQSINLPTPAGSVAFGSSVTVLPNGNYVVTDPKWKNGADTNVGAVYLYNGQTNALIATLTGSGANDKIGSQGVISLSNGNYVVSSSFWSDGPLKNAGAVTWCSGLTGINGVVSSANSLVGSTESDRVGFNGDQLVLQPGTLWTDNAVTPLPNGNYIVSTPQWSNGTVYDAGAVTWGNGTTGVSGVINAANSLIGSQKQDRIGLGGITVLANNNYVVCSYYFNSGSGAATWGNGATGTTGIANASNSLVGGQTDNLVCYDGVVPLRNGNYLVCSPIWGQGGRKFLGAVTWGNGGGGTSGVISSSNSLVGSQGTDQLGHDRLSRRVTALTNGNYIVCSPNWANGGDSSAGAVTWGNGVTGTFGEVSSSNSLIGNQKNDRVGSGYPAVLSNGNCVVGSNEWRNGTIANAGAATWINGATGIAGVVSSSNSLVGTQESDNVGEYVSFLELGNYVVVSPSWSNGTTRAAGAVTWGNGTTGTTGLVSTSNSLTGSQEYDLVGGGPYWGSIGITPLKNGNYVVSSSNWNSSSMPRVGAVTWCNGATGLVGTVSRANSLTGTQALDQVGSQSAEALTNGNYVVKSPNWNNGTARNAGAATWCNGVTGLVDTVSSSNSLIGSHDTDRIGYWITALKNGNYTVNNLFWNNGAVPNAGAITWGNGAVGIKGIVSPANSLVGTHVNDRFGGDFSFPLEDGNYFAGSYNWSNGNFKNAGAFTLGKGTGGTTGYVSNCQSLTGNNSGSSYYARPQYNKVYDKIIAGWPMSNYVSVLKLAQGTVALSSTAVVQDLTGVQTAFYNNGQCGLIALLEAAGTHPVEGNVEIKLKVQPGTPTNGNGAAYCRRSHAVLPANNTDSATGKLTLYFTQADFDDYNANNGSAPNLPTSANDAAGKAALRINQQRGTSVTGNFGTFAGWGINGAANELIIPGDSNVVWNANLSCWEVQFPQLGFGGFFISSGNSSPLPAPRPGMVQVGPNPAGNTLNLFIADPALLGTRFAATGIYGNQMGNTLITALSTQINIQSWQSGIYLLKFADGSVVKVVKQ